MYRATFLTAVLTASLLQLTAIGLTTQAAETRTYRDASGRITGTATRNGSHTTYRDAQGHTTATASTSGRTTRTVLKEGELLAARVESAVAWTTRPPTGFAPRIRLRDLLIPRPRDKNLMLHFYGPGVVWLEGSDAP